MKKPASKVAEPAQIQPKSQFLFYKNLPPRDFSLMTLIIDNENEASFALINSDISPVEKEVLLYDLSDLLGAVGGSLGVGVGISVFAVISCCIDNFFKLLNMFQSRKSKKNTFSTRALQNPYLCRKDQLQI